VVPTYGEADNVDELVRRVGRALRGIEWELIVVDDDSPDGTAERVRTLARRDRRVHRLALPGRPLRLAPVRAGRDPGGGGVELRGHRRLYLASTNGDLIAAGDAS
jgi:glycosyltransferase involved in cell wall biosynthesis